MKLEEKEVREYMEADRKFHDKCYEIFLLTIQSEQEGTAEFDSFDIYDEASIIFYKDFEGDLCEFDFPTSWLCKECGDISKEYEELKEKQCGGRFI